MCRRVMSLALLTVALMIAGTSGLRFSDDKYLVTVTETPAGDSDDEIDIILPTPIFGVVFTAACTEGDGNPVADSSDLRYSVIEGGEGVFSIDATTGQFSVADQPFDYEEQPWHLVSLLCYLNSDPSNNGTGAVNVTIGPVNEYLPEIESTQTTGTLAETASVGTKIAAVDASIGPLLTYSATDRDDGPDGAIKYLLSTDDERIQKFFRLENSTGTLTLNEGLDVDDLPDDVTFERLEIPITACNENVQISICKNIVLILFITSANDNLPEFTQPQYTASVNESATNGTVLLQVECSDEDNGVGAVQSITFHENTPNTTTAAFVLDPITGALSIQSELDYEKTTSYQFTLVCSDGENTATTQVSVSVLSENDNSPLFTVERYEFSAYRTDTSPSDTIIGTVEATDADQGEVGGTVTYSISSSYFEIDQETGEIALKGYLSINDGGTFEFEVVASDGEHETTASVRVTTTGLLSVPEWIYVGLGGAALLVVLVIVGIIVFYCFIKAARVRIVEKYKEHESTASSSRAGDQADMVPDYHPHMFPHPAMFAPDGGRMSMVGQPLYQGMDEEEEEFSEHSTGLGTLEGSQYRMTPGPVLKEVVDYFHEGDRVLDKKGGKK